ncbi:MAG: hypothetical protein KBT11_01845 [Treponema sp.]|nr:hypothetical protein [Candidatus Treponema equifaecale]
MKTLKKIALAASIVSALSLVACSNIAENDEPAQTSPETKQETGFTIKFPGKTENRSSYYSQNDAEKYSVTVKLGETTAASKEGLPGETVSISLTEEGTYTIEVAAFNKDGKEIAKGSTEEELKFSAEKKIVKVKITPNPKPTIDLDVDIEWGEIPIEKAAPGDVITIDGEEIVVLANTYYQESSRAASSARAIQVEGLSPEQNNLIQHYMEKVKVNQMLHDVNINQYVQGWKKGDTKINMPYLNGGVVYASDYFYYFDKNKKKIAQFQLNWESPKVYMAITNASSEEKTLEAVQKFEEMTGLPKTFVLPSSRYNYTEIDVAKYAEFRKNNDPNVFKCQSFPENIDPSKLSEKKEIQYTYKYVTEGEGDSKSVKVTSFDKDNLNSWYQVLYYQMINNKAVSAYYDYPESVMTGSYGTYNNRQFALRENGSYQFYQISRSDYTAGTNNGEYLVKITASGKGEVKGNVSAAEYKNETQIRTNTQYDLFDLTKKVSGSLLTGENASKAVNYRLRFKKSSNSDKTKPLTEQTVEFYPNASDTSTKESLTLSATIAKYFSKDVILSEETTEINGWTIPSQILFRATFLTEGISGHNKKYIWVKLIPEVRDNDFVYIMPVDQKVAGNDVPEFVKIFAENLKAIYETGSYDEDYVTVEDEDNKDNGETNDTFAQEFVEAGKSVDFGTVLTSNFTKLSEDSTLADTRDNNGYRLLTGLWKINGLNVKSTPNNTSANGCMRLYVDEEDITKIVRINFSGESILTQSDSKQIADTDTVNLASAKGYIKVPVKENGTLKFTGVSANNDYCGKFVVADSTGKILLAETCGTTTDANDAAQATEYSVAITGDAYILFSREGMMKTGSNGSPSATGGAHIYKIWVE